MLLRTAAHIHQTARSEMIIHLLEHQALGDKVPARTFERLKREIREQGDEL